MGMDAELIAIGKFDVDIRSSLCYPDSFYDDTPIGAIVITTVINCCTTDQSEKLARALVISPWQFEEHCELDGKDADLDLLAESAEGGIEDVADFLNLRAHGFKFYYLPNG